MIAANQARIDLSRELEDAVSRREFVAYFQPRVATASGKVIGFEALVRWNHAERGVVGPNHFIEVAESSDLIVRIGEQMLLETVRATRVMKEARIVSNISVNASSRELSMPGYAHRFLEILRDHDVDACAISVELLETVALDDSNEEISANLNLLMENGVRTWIDDFGVGFSTVGVLQHGYIYGIKIDRRFVCAKDSANEQEMLLNAIVRMARGMGKSCVLEGVESEAEANYAKEIGCDAIQGYYYAKPMPLDQLLLWCQERGVDGPEVGRAVAHG